MPHLVVHPVLEMGFEKIGVSEDDVDRILEIVSDGVGIGVQVESERLRLRLLLFGRCSLSFRRILLARELKALARQRETAPLRTNATKQESPHAVNKARPTEGSSRTNRPCRR